MLLLSCLVRRAVSLPSIATFTNPRRRHLRFAAAAALLAFAAVAGAQTTWTVNSTDDSNTGTGTTGTLRWVLGNASGDDTVNITATGTITLTSPLPPINKSLTINGPGTASQLIISGAGQYGVFSIGLTNLGPTVNIYSLTIANSVSTTSGQDAIYANSGSVTVSGCNLTGNKGGDAGAIYVGTSASLNVGYSTFSGNSASNAAGSGNAGGAIFSNSGVSVFGSSFTGNSGQFGGAIYALANLVVQFSTFSGNTATTNYGGAILAGNTMNVTNSTFSANSANSGGAIMSEGTGTLANNTFSGNSATAEGGAVENLSTLSAYNNIFTGNSAPSGFGSGINNPSATLQASNNLMTGENGDDCDSGSGCPTDGVNGNEIGSAYSAGLLPLGNYGGTTETFLPLPGTSAVICKGSSTYAVDSFSNPLTIDQRGFVLNSSCVDIGAVQTNYMAVNTSADSTDTLNNCIASPEGTCSLRDAITQANNSTNTAREYGDIDFQSGANLTLPGTITLGSALPDITGFVNIVGPGANQLTVNANATSGNPLRVFTVDSGAIALLYGLTVTGGYTPSSPAPLYSSGGGIGNVGTLTVEESAISGNTAADGGGIDNEGEASIISSTLSGNSVGFCGGGILNDYSGTMTIAGSTISGNTSVGTGGSGFCSFGTLTITGSTVAGNAATNSGAGGIEAGSGTMSMGNTIVAGNTDYTFVDPTSVSNINGSYTNLGGNIVGGSTNATTSLVNGTGAAITLSPLQYNGLNAALQTMIPAPGNPAICGGLASNIPSGTTTDERGYPLQPSGGYCPSGTVDSGAVQTNYTTVGFLQQPAGATSTTPGSVAVSTNMTTPAIVQVIETDTLLSSPGNTDYVNGLPITMTLANGNSYLTGNTATTAGSGQATFTNLQVSHAEMDDTLSIPAVTSGFGPFASYEFNVLGSLSQFAISAPSTAAAGHAFSVTVTAEDAGGNVITNYTGTVQFSTSDPGASVILPNNYQFQPGDNGEHTFTNSVSLVTAGSQTVTAQDTTTPGITGSANVTVNPSTATHLAFTGQPSATATAGVAFATQPVVSLEDGYGNVVTTDSTDTVTISRGNQGTDALQGGPLTVTLANGVATFSGLSYDVAQTLNLQASTNAAGVFSPTSNSIVVSPAAETQLIPTLQPSFTATAGVAFARQPVFKLEDQFGNVATGDSTSTVTVSRGNIGSAALQGSNLTITVVNGVAAFSGLSYNKAETFNISASSTAVAGTATTQLIVVSPGTPTKLVVTQQPSFTATAGVAFATQPVIKLEDAFGNIETDDSTDTVTVARGNQGTASLQGGSLTVTMVNGVASFSGLSYNKAETMNIQASTSAGIFSTTTNSIVVNPAAESQLAFTGQPSATATAGVAFATQPIVSAEDQFGNVVTSDSSSTVTISRGTLGTSVLQGFSFTVTLQNGMAAFSGLSYDKAETINLLAGTSSGGVSFSTSNSIVVGAGAASVIVTSSGSPQSAVVETAFANPLAVTVTDQYGNLVPGASVTFTAPGGGASGTFSNSAATITDTTNAIGQISESFTANSVTGSYTISASTAGVATPASFSLTNNPPPNFVVNATGDDASGMPSNCPANPSSSGPGSCMLRDALSAAGAAGAGNITFDPTVFLASNTALQNTIGLTGGTLNIPTVTTITGLTTGSGASLANLVTIDGTNIAGSPIMTIPDGATGDFIVDLNFANGNAPNGGAINVAGTAVLTVGSSNFTLNVAQSGGAIYSGGALTVNDSTFSANKATGDGGGIYVNSGSAAVNYSTFNDNKAYGSDGGGGIYAAAGTVTITNSTLSLNKAPGGIGGGIDNAGGAATLNNTIVAGNKAYIDADAAGVFNSANSFNNLIGDPTGESGITNGGNGNIVGESAGLATIGAYGGPTQTMIPLPGSPAICNGSLAALLAAIPSGVTVDQRGFANTNTAYPGHSSNACMDIGAVQTNYALGFSVNAPAFAYPGVPMSPAPAVALTESGMTAAQASGPTVAITDADGAITGTLTSALASGVATFPNLVDSVQVVTDDTLQATMPLTSSITLTSPLSSQFSTGYYTITITAGNSQSAPVGLVYNTPLQVQVVDALSNPVSGATVTFTAPTTHASVVFSNSLSNISVATDPTGSASETVTANTVSGLVKVNANMTGASAPATFVLTNTAGPFAKFAVASPPTVYAGLSFPTRVTAEDQYGNTVITFPDTVHVTSSDHLAVLPPDSTLHDGTGEFSATLNTLGAQTFTVTDTNPSNPISSNSNTIRVNNPVFLVVNTTQDDDPASAANCSVQPVQGTNPIDSSCSLRDALLQAAAQKASSITFDSTVFATNQTITLGTAGSLVLVPYTTVTGPAAGVTVSGNGLTTPFLNNGVPDTYLTNIVISDGNAASALLGGAIYNDGELTLTNVTMTGNTANQGAGIYNDYYGELQITNTTITGNSATTASTGGGIGGGVYNDGILVLSTDTISGNTANAGGGIFNDYDGVLQTLTSTIANNTATGLTRGQGGAIYNNSAFGYSGEVLVENSTISNNSAAGSTNAQGGAIFNGGLLVLEDDTLNANFASGAGKNAGGGALCNCGGTAFVVESTFAGNYATGSKASRGGAIANHGQGSLSIASTTITGNAGGVGGGIYFENGVMALLNTLVYGNTLGTVASPGNYDDLDDLTGSTTFTGGAWDAGGNVVGLYNSPSATFVPLLLSPLASNGGAARTIIPLPGNPAICAGLASNLFPGSTTDQRGKPNTTTYTVGSSTVQCVDAGSVQTNYQIVFTQQPSTSSTTGTVAPGAIISPAPAVTVTESGAGINGGPVTLSVAAGTLSGTTSLNPAGGGTATFNGVSISPAETGEIMTATLPLNLALTPPLSISATSYAFNVQAVAPTLTSPSSSVNLGGPTIFIWNAGVGSTEFQLYVGTTGAGSFNLYKGPDLAGTVTSSAPINIPINGGTLNVRLWYLMNGAWQFTDYTYTEGTPPSITSPAAGTLLGGNTVFTWDPGAGSSQFQVYVGTTGAGSHDIYQGPDLAGTVTSSASISVPIGGAPIYVRLWYVMNNVQEHVDYTYNEETLPAITSPALGTALGGKTTFTWNPGAGWSAFQIYVGTTGAGSHDFYQGPDLPGTATSSATINVPLSGATLYVRLWYESNNVWKFLDYTYTEGTPPSITSPAAGTFLGGTTVFTWSPGTGSTQFQVYVGTTGPGSRDLLWDIDRPGTATSSAPVTIPVGGGTVYVRLWYQMNGNWLFQDYTYTEAARPSITSPAISTLLGGKTTFTWNAGSGQDAFQLYVGTTGAGSSNLYQGPDLAGTVTSSAPVTIPVNGASVYVRLWFEKNGNWQSLDYTYTEASAPFITGPSPTSTISGSTTFVWNPASGADAYQVYVGTSAPGSHDLYQGPDLPGTATSSAAISIPNHGASLYVRLWFEKNNSWQYQDYTYTEGH